MALDSHNRGSLFFNWLHFHQ